MPVFLCSFLPLPTPAYQTHTLVPREEFKDQYINHTKTVISIMGTFKTFVVVIVLYRFLFSLYIIEGGFLNVSIMLHQMPPDFP